MPDLFGRGQDKGFFYVFDFRQNLGFFSQDRPSLEGNLGESLSARQFRTRLEATAGLDERIQTASASNAEAALRGKLIETLRGEAAAINIDNFIIRRRRKQVEHRSKPEPWGGTRLQSPDGAVRSACQPATPQESRRSSKFC